MEVWWPFGEGKDGSLKLLIRVELGFKPKCHLYFTMSLFHDIHLTVRGRGMGSGDPTIE